MAKYLVLTKEQLTSLLNGEEITMEVSKKITRTLTTTTDLDRAKAKLRAKYESTVKGLETRYSNQDRKQEEGGEDIEAQDSPPQEVQHGRFR